MKPLLYLLFFLGVCPIYLNAQSTALTTYFEELERRGQHNGNILVADKGQVLIDFSSGYADFRTKTLNTSSVLFNLASISKVLTATAILQLRDKGKFRLDDPVLLYLPDFPYKEITIRHLLTHTSGLPDLELFEELVREFPDTIVTNRNVIPEIIKWHRGLYFKPGDEFRYCNTEYNLLALLIEKVSGLRFAAYLKKYIFDPSGMKDTYVCESGNSNTNQLIAQPQMKPHPGYDSIFIVADSISRFKYLTHNISGTIGQGNVMSTTKDMLKFDRTYFKEKLIKLSSMQEAMAPLRLNNGTLNYQRMDTMDGEGKMTYGLGWEIFEQPLYGIAVGHGGYKLGLATFYFHSISKDQTLIGFDNTAGSEFGRFMSSSQALLNAQQPMVFRTSKSLVTLYGSALVKKGADHAAAIYNSNKSNTVAYYLNEGEMNDLGYNLFYMSTFSGHKEMALEVFKLATFIFPDSYNTYDSYGQLLKEMGNKEDAIRMYQKSIAINPRNEEGKRMLKQLAQD